VSDNRFALGFNSRIKRVPKNGLHYSSDASAEDGIGQVATLHGTTSFSAAVV
jgi:hypothetical protein